ncbi:RidA family protein [Haloarchaeobius iranensis]|uniref:2-iminobutanoate/2-iminopropanoate deaminase n=1 Tax=Haloarchaeobius iranensis TaxID=996166 RepID=A0A1H0BYY5_9EURY|nr:RidA family protein [Haloarchaeobius iranensis]SDN50710.1 2-iminobutanoate/2-iminopropanoate deaminase [Haloarchaeobius iranensis]
MEANSVSDSQLVRASESSRKQRDGAEFIGGYGKKTGDSDLLFIEGQLPEEGDRIASDASPERQLDLCLQNLETELERQGKEMSDVLQLTLYLAEMDAYERVNDTYKQYFEETFPARTTVGVCELLGDATVTVDAVVAIE